MKNNHLKSILLFLFVGLGFIPTLRAGNTVTISSVAGSPNDIVTVDVSLNNDDAVSALQLDIPFDKNVSYVANSCKLTDRKDDHIVSAGIRNDTLHIYVYSLSMMTFKGTNGKLLSFQLKLAKNPETLTMNAGKLLLTNAAGTPLVASCVSGTLTIRCPKTSYSTSLIDFGKVPIHAKYNKTLTISNIGNEDLVISNLVFSDTTFRSSMNFPLTIGNGKSADINISYSPVARGDTTATMQIVSNTITDAVFNVVSLKAQPYAVNELHISNASGMSDSTVTISLTVNSMDEICGFQFNFALPSQLEYVDGSFALSDRKKDHLALANIDGQTLKLLCYSLTNATFTENDGIIATFKVKLVGQYGCSLTTTSTILTSMIDKTPQNVTSATYGGYISIQSPSLSVNSNVTMGTTPISNDVKSTLVINNYGSANLIIDKIVFDTLGFSVPEAVPMIIAPWQSKAITITYNGITDGKYKTIMQIYCNDPSNRVYNVYITGDRFEPNYITLNADKIKTTDSLNIKIALDNYTALNGLQFDFKYPNKYYTTKVSDFKALSRISDFTTSVTAINDSVYRILIYSLSDKQITKGNGDVMSIALSPKANVTAGKYMISTTNIKLGNTNLTNVLSGDATIIFNATVVKPGDANNDGNIDVSDIISIIGYMTESPSASFIYNAANVNDDDEISVADIVGVVNIIFNDNSVLAKAFSPMTAGKECVSLLQTDNHTIAVNMNNIEKYTAFQFDLSLPEHADISLNKNRCDDHNLIIRQLKNGLYRVIVYSMTNKDINENDGSLINISLPDSINNQIFMDHILFVTKDGKQSAFNKEFLKAATNINNYNIEQNENEAVNVYDINGIYYKTIKYKTEIKNLGKGIYIINNKLIIIK